jgi:glycosyltransferase involved in cell wall biosynthesis
LVRAAYASAIGADFIYQRHARFSICGALLSRLTGRPLILEFNGSEAWVQRHWQPTPLTGQLLRCESSALAAAACIVVVSDAERRTLERRGIASHRILVNPNGVDVDRFARGGGRQRRHALGFGDDDFVVGFVGTFGPWHGAPVLARAFGALAAREPRARLLLVGDGPERSAVREELARNSSLDRAVLIERVPPADVPELLDACDALASPHVWKPDSGEFFGSPTKLFEYMASAKPIVASRLGQIAEVLEHERTALLVESGDADALAGALERLAREPALGERLGQAARVAAGDSHSWRLNAQRVLSAYDRIVSTSGIRSERA